MKALVVAAIVLCCTVASPPLGLAQPRADDESSLLVDEARAALARRDYERAGELLDRALRVDPRQIHVYVLRASVYGAAKRHDASVAILRKARALAPDNLDVLTSLGVQLVFGHDAAEGVPLLERVVARAPGRYEAQSVLGLFYARSGSWQRAIVALEAYLAARPSVLAHEDWSHRVHLAEARLRAGEPGRARTLYRQVLAVRPTSTLARLGLLWATAAIDCREARGVARAVGDLVARYPVVLLVEAQCALALQDRSVASSLLAEYRRRVPTDAHGWGLTGRLEQARGRMDAARRAFERATALAPDDMRWVLELARTDRRDGFAVRAARRLRVGTPPPELELEWDVELSWALLDAGQPEEASRLLMPVVAAHRDYAPARVVLGMALLELDQLDGAIEHLERGIVGHESVTALARKRLAHASELRGRKALDERQLAAAVDDLSRAVELGAGSARQPFAAVLIASAEFARAGEVLDDIAEPTPIDLVLRAKAHAGLDQLDGAERALERALELPQDRPSRQRVSIELASLRVRRGRPEQAVEVLATAVAEAPATALDRRALDAFSTAGLAAANDALAAGNLRKAQQLLANLGAKLPKDHPDGLTVVCYRALAATGAGARDVAADLVRQLARSKGSCPFAAPADKLAVPILEAWSDGLVRGRAEASLSRLARLRRKATGSAEALWRTAVNDVGLRGALAAYQAGDHSAARRLLAAARAAVVKGDGELENAEAVLLLEASRLDDAIRILERVSGAVPEAQLNLGIAWERKGDPARALEHYEAALAAGVRHPKLRDWIDTKRRVWGRP